MEIPYTVKARPDTGLWNAKIGIWLFLASEVMLFGGLFSAYIFLRLAPEGPWPVQVLTVKWGFINTLVLILSSVTVLQAWVALKLRKYGAYMVWMALTILCALGFLGIKAVEYNDKFHHYGVRLHDGSVMEGHLPAEGYLIKFEDVKTVKLASRHMDQGLFGLTLFPNGSDGDFLNYITDGGKPEFKDEAGNNVVLTSKKVREMMNAARKAKKPEIVLQAVNPLKFAIPPRKLFDNAWDNKQATFRDSTVIEGRLADDTLRLEVDKVDLRWLFPHDAKVEKDAFDAAEKAEAWKLLGAEWLEKFKAHREAELKHFAEHHAQGKNPMENDDYIRKTYSLLNMTLGDHAAHGDAKPHGEAKPHGATAHPSAAPEHGAAAAASDHGGHGHPSVAVPRKDIAHFSNFTPKWHNYYAIYFTLTGLHGLHVLAGALVLTYFFLFGRKLYNKDPEHMANRVEVGGLFWHFVDLVWIFLFPLLYLL